MKHGALSKRAAVARRDPPFEGLRLRPLEAAGVFWTGLARGLACAIALATWLCACGGNSHSFDRTTIENAIDQKLPTEYHQLAPELPLGHASCPDEPMNLEDGQTGRCAFELGALSIPVTVSLDSGGQLQFSTQNDFFDTRHIESYVAKNSSQSNGSAVRADCGSPRYRVLESGATIACTIHRGGATTPVTVTIGDGGRIAVSSPTSASAPAGDITQPLIAKHVAGRPVIVAGSTIEQAFKDDLAQMRAANASTGLVIGDLLCPAKVDLSDTKRAVCSLDLSGKPIRVAFWIDGTEWHTETLDVAFSRSVVEARAVSYYQALERNNGFTVPIAVHCPWPDVVVFTPPASRDCVLHIANQQRRLTIQIPDRTGRYRYNVAP